MRQIIACLTLLLLPACGVVGMATPVRTYTTNSTITLSKPAQNFIDITSEVGTSLGYKVSGVDPEKQSVTLDDNVGGVATMLIGKVVERRIVVTLQPGGRAIRFDIMVAGNMSSASQEKAEARLDTLKRALAERFR